MKVCLLSTHRKVGGAAISAYRLKDALETEGGCEVVDLYRFTREEGCRVDWLEDLRLRGASLAAGATAREGFERRFVSRNRTTESLALFSGDAPDCDLARVVAGLGADVINLHWITFFVNPAGIRALAALGKPIVWTLHDERAFTGGCHYAGGCTGFRDACSACPQLEDGGAGLPSALLSQRLELLGDVAIHFVTPSRWLAEQLRSSRLFDDRVHSVDVIPYSLDLGTFRPAETAAERSVLRERFGLSAEDFCIVAGSVNWSDERKGARFLQRAFVELSEKIGREESSRRIRIVSYGRTGLETDAFPVRNIGFLNGEGDMADLLKCCDLYVTMTREDNLPNTVLESLACGLPVIATEVGGVPEMVEDGKNGRLVPRDDSAAMAEALYQCIATPQVLARWSMEARRIAEENYAPSMQGRSYRTLFDRLLESPPRPPGEGPGEPVAPPAPPGLYEAAVAEWAESEELLRSTRQKLKQAEAKLGDLLARVGRGEREIESLRRSWSYRLGWLLLHPWKLGRLPHGGERRLPRKSPAASGGGRATD